MLQDFALGQGSIVLRVKLRRLDTGQGLAGLASNSTGLVIGTIADVEAATTAYTAAGATIEAIATLGTYAAPTAGKCRFREVDATNHPGLYELQFADARFAVASAKSTTISVSGVANLADCDARIPLLAVDPYSTAAAADLAAVKAKTDKLVELNLDGTVVDASPGASSFKGDNGLSAADGWYVGGWLAFTSGPLKGLSHKVTGYTGATRLLAFGSAFPAAPADGDAFTILGGTS